MMIRQYGKLDWVQALRGVAALLVVLCHARDYLRESPNFPFIESILLPGAMGVDLFFIISGFIMVYSTRNTNGSIANVKDFAIKRFTRIWPTYMICTILWVLIADVGITYFNNTNNWIVFFKSIFFIPVKDMAPLYFAPIIPLGWTLNFEMYFYAIFGATMLLGRFRLIAMLIWMLIFVIVIPATTRHFSFNPFTFYTLSPNYLNLMANPIILEFVVGAIIGHLYLSEKFKIKGRAAALHFMLISIGFMIWYNYSGAGDLHGITKWGFSLSIMVFAIAIASKTLEIKVPKALTWLGKISFSLYLTHYITRAAMDHMISSVGYATSMHTWSYIIFSVSICITVAGVSQHLLEEKLSNFIKDKLSKSIASKATLAL